MELKDLNLKKHTIIGVILFFIIIIISFFFLDIFFIIPKFFVLIIIIGTAILFKKSKIFLKDWLVFLSFIYLFDSLRGLVYYLICKFDFPVYTIYVIKLEKILFGTIPSVFLQNLLLNSHNHTNLGILEKSLTILYGTHFLAFLMIGFLIWIHKPENFKSYKLSFYLLISIGVTIYFIVPTAPPWIASRLFKVFPEPFHFNIFLFNMSIPDLTAGFDVNPVGAMPSLHAAFPALCSFILWHLYRWKGSFFYIYTFLIFFTIVYTGDHYVIDIIAGVGLAFLCYIFSFKIKKKDKILINKNNFHPVKKNFLYRYNHIIIGILLLITGISLGTFTKKYFQNHSELYEIRSAAPNYVDFFNHIEKYKSNFHIQYYYANHLLTNNKYKKALHYFKQALNLSQNSSEKHKALRNINYCKLLLDQKN